MKILVNGGLNLSELDGWWAEAYSPPVGWALGDGEEHGDDPAWDLAETEKLYDILENEVIPAFYNRDADGIAAEWVTRMRESMSRLTPWFSADRAVREYTESYYLPAAAAYRERAADHGAYGSALLQWEQALANHWASLRFGELRVTSHSQEHAFTIEVHLGELRSAWVRVELYADSGDGGPPLITAMTEQDGTEPAGGWLVYAAQVPASRPASDYTPRIVPSYSGAKLPLENAGILWFR
jgi:starch phosphorylase